MDDLSVEVLGNKDLYYKARVVNVLADEILVVFENSSKPPFRVPFDKVRLPPKSLPQAPELKEGDDVEVCQPMPEEDALAWIPMRVRMMKGDFVVVEIPNSQPTLSNIVEVDSVRLPNNSTCITASTFHRLSIDVPTDLHTICQDVANHHEFKQRCGASLIQFSAESSALIVLSRSEAILKKASLLGDLHIRSLRQKMQLLQLTEESARKLENTRHQPARSPSLHSVEFNVPHDLMGLAIGAQGCNIQRARQIPGVQSIDITEESSTFTVQGETEEAVNAARKLLEYTERRIQLPRDMISRIIGRNGHNIQTIVDQSGVIRVKIEGDNEAPHAREEGFVPFIFVGTVESIDNAKLLLDYHIAHLKEVEELTREKQRLDAELHSLSLQNHHPSNANQAPYHGYRDGGGREGGRGRGRGGGNHGRWANGNRPNEERNGPSNSQTGHNGNKSVPGGGQPNAPANQNAAGAPSQKTAAAAASTNAPAPAAPATSKPPPKNANKNITNNNTGVVNGQP